MVGAQHVDDFSPSGGRNPRSPSDRDDGIGAANVGVKARHVVEHADLDGLVLRQSGPARPTPASMIRRSNTAQVCWSFSSSMLMPGGFANPCPAFPFPAPSGYGNAPIVARRSQLNFWIRLPVSLPLCKRYLWRHPMAWIQWNCPALRPLRPNVPQLAVLSLDHPDLLFCRRRSRYSASGRARSRLPIAPLPSVFLS